MQSGCEELRQPGKVAGDGAGRLTKLTEAGEGRMGTLNAGLIRVG